MWRIPNTEADRIRRQTLMGLRVPFILVLSLLCIPCTAQDTTPTFQHDNQRTGRTGNRGLKMPYLRWSFRSDSSIEASAVNSKDGTIYLASTDGRLYALSDRGVLKWTFSANESLVATPAVGPDGTIMVADLAGWYYAVRPDGSLKWSHQLTGGALERRVTSPPAVAESGQSFVAAWNDRLYSFTPDGSLLWTHVFEGEGQISAAPALDLEGNVYVATHDPFNKYGIAVIKFEPATGSIVWKFTDDLGNDRNRIISSPAIDLSRGRLYVGAARDTDGCVYAVNLSTGAGVFRTVLPRGIISSPALGRDGTIYVGCLDGRMYALDPATGGARWNFETGAYYVMGSPAVDGAGTIYIGDSDGALHALTSDGHGLWDYALQSNIVSSPSIADDGTVYVTCFDSTFYAIGGRSGRRARR